MDVSVVAEARVATDMPHRYLAQLCKHFQHKVPVELTADHGRIAFGSGVCTLATEPDVLVLRVTAADTEALVKLQDVVARHLLRFAFREPPVVEWIAAA